MGLRTALSQLLLGQPKKATPIATFLKHLEDARKGTAMVDPIVMVSEEVKDGEIRVDLSAADDDIRLKRSMDPARVAEDAVVLATLGDYMSKVASHVRRVLYGDKADREIWQSEMDRLLSKNDRRIELLIKWQQDVDSIEKAVDKLLLKQGKGPEKVGPGPLPVRSPAGGKNGGNGHGGSNGNGGNRFRLPASPF